MVCIGESFFLNLRHGVSGAHSALQPVGLDQAGGIVLGTFLYVVYQSFAQHLHRILAVHGTVAAGHGIIGISRGGVALTLLKNAGPYRPRCPRPFYISDIRSRKVFVHSGPVSGRDSNPVPLLDHALDRGVVPHP